MDSKSFYQQVADELGTTTDEVLGKITEIGEKFHEPTPLCRTVDDWRHELEPENWTIEFSNHFDDCDLCRQNFEHTRLEELRNYVVPKVLGETALPNASPELAKTARAASNASAQLGHVDGKLSVPQRH